MGLDDLAATASAAPAARRLRGFVQWVGEGRPLTQTGRLRRADALALAELLDTGDRLDPRFPIHTNPAKIGVDNPQPPRREMRPFDTQAELEALAAELGLPGSS